MEEKGPVRTTRFWVLVLAVVLAAALAAMALLSLGREEGAVVQVSQDGQVVDTFPLDAPLSKVYLGPEGRRNVVVIENGQVSVTEADCPDQICVRHAPTRTAGDPIVCLPNRLVVEVVTERTPSGVDGVS